MTVCKSTTQSSKVQIRYFSSLLLQNVVDIIIILSKLIKQQMNKQVLGCHLFRKTSFLKTYAAFSMLSTSSCICRNYNLKKISSSSVVNSTYTGVNTLNLLCSFTHRTQIPRQLKPVQLKSTLCIFCHYIFLSRISPQVFFTLR